MYPEYINPNAYAGQFNPPHNPSDSPSGFSQFLWNAAQYGVNMIPGIGSLVGAGMNFASQWYQNHKQEQFYDKYMSPQARMQQMTAAGINPNAAAQGISGSAAPQMTAAAPTSAYTGIGEQLGNSVNTALTAKSIRAEIDKTNAEAKLTESMNVGQQIENKYADAMQDATLRKLVNEGDITRHQANIIAVDDYYKGAEAAAHLEQSYLALETMAAELQNTQQEYFNLLAQEYATMQAGALSEAQIHKVFSDIGLNNAMIEKISHEVENIDASTLSIVQDISESKARERLTRANAQYQEKVNNVWRDSGWNENSDVNSNFHRLCMEGKIDEAKTLMNGTKAMIYNTGEARFHSKDYNMDKLIDVVGFATRLTGSALIGEGASRAGNSPQFRRGIFTDSRAGHVHPSNLIQH